MNESKPFTIAELAAWQRGVNDGVRLERRKWLHPWRARRYHFALLREWCGERSTTSGSFANHFPIDNTTHGYRTEPDKAWGCNACGIGWPCLVVRSRAAIGDA